MAYVIKAVHKRTGSKVYYLQGHSKLSEGATQVSKYYVWSTSRGAKSLMNRLKNQPDGDYYDWSVVDTDSENIEVV